MPSKTTRRRPKGEGSIITLPSGKVRIRVELDPVDGKRRWLSATADTKKEAVEKLKKLQRDKEDKGLQAKAEEDTIKYQGEVYLKHLEAQRMSGSVIITTRRVLKLLDNTANGLALSKVTSHTIDTMLLEWQQKNYSTNTYLNYIGRLRLFFKWCVEQDLIGKSPVTSMQKTPKSDKPKHEVVVLSQEEHERIKAFLLPLWEHKEKPMLKYQFYALYCLAYETGMREGELLALTWDCLDDAANTISVKRTLAKDKNNKTIVTYPKTQAGYRTIKISEKTTQLLMSLKPLSFDKSPYIFYNRKRDSFYVERLLIHAWDFTRKGAGITRPFTFHGIRHTNASNMIYKHVPIALITERLGHTSIAVTYAIYGHILQECSEKHVAVIEA